jgi:hypothetical protein
LAFTVSLKTSRSSVVASDSFTLTMTISNVAADMSLINVTLIVTERYTGMDASNRFVMTEDQMSHISDIHGNGNVTANSTATVIWNVLALNNTAAVETIYSFSGFVTFMAQGKFPEFTREIENFLGKVNTIPFYKSSITVYPSTLVFVDYFIPAAFSL